MTVTLPIPDVLAPAMQQMDLPRLMLESFAVEGYRSGTLSAKQVRLLLGHESRWQTEDFLAAHGAWPGITPEEASEDSRQLGELLGHTPMISPSPVVCLDQTVPLL
jgi:hypothetical protein